MRILCSGLRPEHRFDYPAIVRDLVRRLPPEHLKGLDYITVSGDPPLDDDDDVLGQYYDRFDQEAPGIVLYLDVMRREAPAPLLRFETTWKVLIAQTLYHEIGHHYQHFTHGIAKERQEDHAEAYGDRWSRAAFPRAYVWIDAYERLRRAAGGCAIALLTLKARVRPTARTWHRIGRRHEGRGDLDRAVAAWEESLAIDPAFEPALLALPSARRRLARKVRQLELKALKPVSARRGRRPRRHGGRRGRHGRRRT